MRHPRLSGDRAAVVTPEGQGLKLQVIQEFNAPRIVGAAGGQAAGTGLRSLLAAAASYRRSGLGARVVVWSTSDLGTLGRDRATGGVRK